jgi:hypothetical protein
MTRDEAIAKARQIAREREWPWEEPIVVRVERRFVVFGRKQISVMSNANARGGNVFVTLEADTGDVVHAAYGPR